MADFPDDFLWGASTAAHQVEGDLRDQWTEWEQANAERLAVESPRRLSWLPFAKSLKGQWDDPQNYISGNGVEHYERFEADFDIARELQLNAFRFSLEWSRLEPREGEWDAVAVAYYHRYVTALKQRGIEPILTLWHWTIPVWFTEKGAFEKRSNLQYFERFVQKVADEFGPELHYVVTLNEPNVYAAFSYVSGEWPPQRRHVLLGLQVYRNLVQAHRRAHRILKHSHPNLQVGLAAQLADIRCTSPRGPLNRLVAASLRYAWNWWFLDQVRRQTDFIGVNYYFTEYRDWRGRLRNPKQPVNDLGWYMEPAGIEQVLAAVWTRYKLPIIITENGVADGTDKYRQWWLAETFAAMRRAMGSGVWLKGYLHWSLLDNFEWAYGWWPKFGLVAVDRVSMKRTVRPSAHWLAKQIESYRRGK